MCNRALSNAPPRCVFKGWFLNTPLFFDYYPPVWRLFPMQSAYLFLLCKSVTQLNEDECEGLKYKDRGDKVKVLRGTRWGFSNLSSISRPVSKRSNLSSSSVQPRKASRRSQHKPGPMSRHSFCFHGDVHHRCNGFFSLGVSAGLTKRDAQLNPNQKYLAIRYVAQVCFFYLRCIRMRANDSNRGERTWISCSPVSPG